MKRVLGGTATQWALVILLALLVNEWLLELHTVILNLAALPAAGLLMGQLNRGIQHHVLLHSVQLVTLFAGLLLAIYASELAATGGVLFFLITFPAAFYYGFRYTADSD